MSPKRTRTHKLTLPFSSVADAFRRETFWRKPNNNAGKKKEGEYSKACEAYEKQLACILNLFVYVCVCVCLSAGKTLNKRKMEVEAGKKRGPALFKFVTVCV